jgi:hypothetical protein
MNTIVIANNEIQEINVSNLNPEATTLLKNFFTAGICNYLEVPYEGDFDFTDNFFTVNVKGNTTPTETSQANLLLQINISYDLSYNGCVESLPFMGDECY